MTTDISLILIAAVSIVVFIYFIKSAISERAFRAWDISSSFVFILVTAQCLPFIYAHLSGGRVVYYDVNWNLSIQLSPTVEMLQTVCRFGVAILAVSIFVKSCLVDRRLINGASVIAVVIAVLAVLPVVLGDHPDGLVARGAAITLLMATIALPGGRGAVVGLASAGISIGLMTGLLSVLASESSVGACRADKCGPFGYLLYGPTNSENALSILLAVTLPAVFLSFNGKARWILSLYTFFIIFSTGARSAVLACVAVFAITLLLRPSYQTASSPVSRMAARFTAIGGFVVAALIPTLHWSPLDFTGRAGLWQLAISQASESFLFGLGAGAWIKNVSIGLIGSFANYSTHNQWVDMFYVSGLVGIVLFAYMLTLLFRNLNLRSVVPSAYLLTPIAMLSITERPLGFGADDFFVWILPVTLLVVQSVGHGPGGRISDSAPMLEIDRRGVSGFVRQSKIAG